MLSDFTKNNRINQNKKLNHYHTGLANFIGKKILPTIDEKPAAAFSQRHSDSALA